MPPISGDVVVLMTLLLLFRRGMLRRGVLDRLDDVDVAGAAAEVAGDRLADLVLARVRVLLEQGVAASSSCPACRSRTAGRAPARSPPGCGCSLPSCSSPSTVATSRPSAWTANTVQRLDRPAVEQHGAGAAAGGVAADVGAGQPQVFAEEMDQQQARLDLGLVRGAVDGDRESCASPWLSVPSPARWPCCSARAVRTRAISRLYSTEPRRSALGRRGLPRPGARPRRSPRRRLLARRGTSRPSAAAHRRRADVGEADAGALDRAAVAERHLRPQRAAVAKSPTLRSSLT